LQLLFYDSDKILAKIFEIQNDKEALKKEQVNYKSLLQIREVSTRMIQKLSPGKTGCGRPGQ